MAMDNKPYDHDEEDNHSKCLENVKELFSNDKVTTPKIAKLTFDKIFWPVKWGTNDEDSLYKWFF